MELAPNVSHCQLAEIAKNCVFPRAIKTEGDLSAVE